LGTMSPKHNPSDPYRFSAKMDSPKSPGGGFTSPKDRFAEKDSLYLDMGRPEMNGKVDTINTASQNNSLLFKKGSNASVGSDSFSTFANQAGGIEKKKSFKMHSGMGSNGGQSFLKAALLRNMQKNNSDAPNEEYKDDGPSSPANKSLNDRLSHRLLGGESGRLSSASQDHDSEDDGYSQSPKSAKHSDHAEKGKTSFTKRRFQPFAQKIESADAK